MKKFTLLLTLLLFLVCTACDNNVYSVGNTFIVKRVKLETNNGLKNLGKYYVKAESTKRKGQCILFYTDSIYYPGDTLYIKK